MKLFRFLLLQPCASRQLPTIGGRAAMAIPDSTVSRICSKCGEDRVWRWRQPHCNPCEAARWRARWAAMTSDEKQRHWARRQSPRARALTSRRDSMDSKRFPKRSRAIHAVNYAIRVGILIKQPCEVCGSTKRVHGHHDDYDKKLEVRWLCPLHHVEHHRLFGEGKNKIDPLIETPRHD